MNNVNISGPIQPTATYKTKVLKGNHSFASQVTEPNMKYVIKHNFVLDGDVTIPENCILEFDGGSISGEHTITGNNTGIKADLVKIFDVNLTFSGTFINGNIPPEWFGAINNGITDCTNAIQSAIKFANTITKINVYLVQSTATIIFNGGVYKVTDKIIIDNIQNVKVNINGNGCCISAHHSNDSILSFPITHYYSGYIQNINLNGNGNRISGIEGAFDNASINKVNIQNCIKYGIHQTFGYELYIDTVQIAISDSSYYNGISDYNNIIGILLDTNDGNLNNCTIIGYPIGCILNGSEWNINNYHVWGTDVVGCIPRVGIEITGHSNMLTNVYIDTVLKANPQLDYFDTVNGIINGGIGINLKGSKCVINNVKCYVAQWLELPSSPNNLAIYVHGISTNSIIRNVSQSSSENFYTTLIINYGNAAIYGFVPVSDNDKQNYLGYDDFVSNSFASASNSFSKILNFPAKDKVNYILRYGNDWLYDAFTFSTDGTPHISLKLLNNTEYCNFGIESHGVFYTNKPFRIAKYSTTNRPTLDLSQKGVQIFDETLNKPIWWNGTNWVDATGATV